jgi:zinc-finger of transposase IS204/IS1001/IS1096/IS1165
MQDDLTRLVGLEGFEAERVVGVGDQLDLEVELVARAGVCPHCGRASLEVKERPRVRVRDLPVAGRGTDLVWRKRRFGCRPCGRTFTGQHPELPPRQRVTRRFRERLLERVRGGAAHAEDACEEDTTRYQVARAFRDGANELAVRETHPVRRLSLDEAHHRRGNELATVVSDLDRRRVVGGLDAAAAGAWSATCARCPSRTGMPSRWSRSTPTRLPPGDPGGAARGADRCRPLPPRARREHRARLGPARTPARGRAQATEGHPAQRPPGTLAPRALPRPPPACSSKRAADRTRAAPADRAVRARAADRRGLGGSKSGRVEIRIDQRQLTAVALGTARSRRSSTPAL